VIKEKKEVCDEFPPFCKKTKKKARATMSRENFGKFSKRSPHLEEESCEIVKIFGGFGQIFNFLL
jgi:hypothetical protein